MAAIAVDQDRRVLAVPPTRADRLADETGCAPATCDFAKEAASRASEQEQVAAFEQAFRLCDIDALERRALSHAGVSLDGGARRPG